MSTQSHGWGAARRYFLVGFACIQNALCTGLLFGFAALQPKLERCASVESKPLNLAQIFTLASGVNMLAPLFLAGPVLDALGPRFCSCLNTFLVGSGFLLFGVSPALPGHSMSYFFPAMILIAVGGPGSQACLFHTANLFKVRATILNLITAFIGPSFVVFELLGVLSSWYDVSLQRAFLCYSSLPFACTIISVLIMPDEPFSSSSVRGCVRGSSKDSPFYTGNLEAFERQMSITKSPPPRPLSDVRAISFGSARPIVFVRRKRTMHSGLRDPLHEPLLRTDTALPPSRVEKARMGTLYGQVFSKPFADVTFIFTVSSFVYNFFLGNMQNVARASLEWSSLVETPDLSAAAAEHVSAFLTLSPLGTLLNPLLGYGIDAYGFTPILTLTIGSATLYLVGVWLGAFFQGAACFSIFAASFFAYTYSYVAFKFGFDYYGLLCGLVQFAGSMATLAFQPVLRNAATTHGWLQVLLLQLALLGILALFILSGPVLESARRLRTHLRSRRQEGDKAEFMSPGFARSYSCGDVADSPPGKACRRRSDLFPTTDDIMLIDGAPAEFSSEAYLCLPPSRAESKNMFLL